jgi:hypothetical protein
VARPYIYASPALGVNIRSCRDEDFGCSDPRVQNRTIGAPTRGLWRPLQRRSYSAFCNCLELVIAPSLGVMRDRVSKTESSQVSLRP